MMPPLETALERLETLVEGNILALNAGSPIDYAADVAAKSRVLLALSRLSANTTLRHSDAPTIVNRVRAKLETEAALLERQLEAAQTVVDLIADAVLAGDGDGTYGPSPTRRMLLARPS